MATAKLAFKKKKDRVYNPDTNLVIDSTTPEKLKQKIVIGRLQGDEFISLDQDEDIQNTIQLCLDRGLSYDESLVELESDTEEQNEQMEQTEQTEEKQNSKSEEEKIEKPIVPPIVAKIDVVTPTETPSISSPPNVSLSSLPSANEQNSLLLRLTELLQRQNQEISDMFVEMSNSHQTMTKNLELSSKQYAEMTEKKLQTFENDLSESRKELEALKKKYKNVLAALQGDA